MLQADAGEQAPAFEQALGRVLGARDTNARSAGASSSKAAPPHCTPGASSAWTAGSRPSPLTQARSATQTPGTPSVLYPSATPGAAQMADDASSRGATPEWPPAATAAGQQVEQQQVEQQQAEQQQAEQQQAEQQQQQGGGGAVAPAPASQPHSAAGSAVDVADVQRLVATVEGLQRQLAVKNDRIRAMRAALEQAAAGGASFTPAGSRPGSRPGSGGGPAGEPAVLQQRLEAAQRQVASLQALAANLERQLGDARQAQQDARCQLGAASRCLAAALAEHGGGGGASSRPSSALSDQPATAGDAGGVLLLQARQFEDLAAQASEALAAGRRAAAEAQEASAALTLQLASRNKLVEALQSQLRTLASAASSAQHGRSDGLAAATAPADPFLLAPPAAPLPASAGGAAGAASPATADALGSIETISSYWRQACQAKDVQLEALRGELGQVRRAGGDGGRRAHVHSEAGGASRDGSGQQAECSQVDSGTRRFPPAASLAAVQAQDGLSRAQAELELLAGTAQGLAEQQQHAAALADDLQQRLAAAEQRLASTAASEQALSVRCTELEAALLEAQAAAEADGSAAAEARAAAGAAEQQAHVLQQQLSIAEAQVRGEGKGHELPPACEPALHCPVVASGW